MNKRNERLYKVKRVLVRSPKGLTAYYYRNGKRISDAKGRQKWIEQNFDSLDKPYARNQPVLTDKERSSFKNSKAQRGLFYYQGKKIKKFITEILKLTGDLSDKDPRDITKIVDNEGKQRFKNYGELEQLFQEKVGNLKGRVRTELGLIGHRGRTQVESIFSIMEHLTLLGVDNWKLMVIKRDGSPVFGKEKGVQEIQDWELKELSAYTKFSDVASMRFWYYIDYDYATKTIIIDLRLAEGKPMFSL
jgi:hypothetical protein